MGKNKALAHHTSTYFHTRRVSTLYCRRVQNKYIHVHTTLGRLVYNINPSLYTRLTGTRLRIKAPCREYVSVTKGVEMESKIES